MIRLVIETLTQTFTQCCIKRVSFLLLFKILPSFRLQLLHVKSQKKLNGSQILKNIYLSILFLSKKKIRIEIGVAEGQKTGVKCEY